MRPACPCSCSSSLFRVDVRLSEECDRQGEQAGGADTKTVRSAGKGWGCVCMTICLLHPLTDSWAALRHRRSFPTHFRHTAPHRQQASERVSFRSSRFFLAAALLLSASASSTTAEQHLFLCCCEELRMLRCAVIALGRAVLCC